MGIEQTVKKAIKKKLNSGKPIEAETLYESIKDYDYISFDIFDTLVKRNVEEPTDIFSIMVKTVGENFREKRIQAEKRARAELGKVEVTIEDIYSYFTESERQKLIELEMDTELKAIVPNQAVADVYRRCLDSGKTIYITSDMYWPKKTVEELLNKNGYSGYKQLYLSSEEQKVKSNGTLFQELLENEQIRPEQIVHIGDSQKGDYEEPRKLGIKAVRIPRHFKNIEFRGDDVNEKIEVNYLNHFINNTFPRPALSVTSGHTPQSESESENSSRYSTDPYYQFGYSQFGKLLFGYVNWIHDEAVRRGIRKVFFFARDGYIMKQAYEACVDDKTTDTRYLEVSRRSLRGPVLWMDCSYETILKMVVNAKLVSLTSVFDGLGLEINNYVGQIKECDLQPDAAFDRSTIESDEKLRKLIETIKPDIIENSKKEYELLKQYLAENSVEGRFAVVDIGYGGSMQRYLQQVLGQLSIEHDITGFYLAVADFYTKNMLPDVKLDLNGYLFDFQHDPNATDTRRSFVGLFETLFLEQGGSVKRYVADKDGVVAERYPYEYEVDGKPTEDLKKIRRIQDGAIDFVRNASSDELLGILSCGPDEYFVGLQSVGEEPTMKELKLFGDISFYDEGMTEKLAAPKSVTYYVAHPKQMKEDFLKCRWKTGFLKRLLKVNLPYQKMYERLRSMG
ncbi:MAG: hypothetical protein IJX90_11150 [Blautia sp.]|nr:hypothetical protein [Blautia sp.]